MNRTTSCWWTRWFQRLCVLALLPLSVYGGMLLSWRWHGLSIGGDSSLSRAVRLAQEEVDRCYGPDAFVYGVRRILKDGCHDYYAFQVKVCVGDGMTNLLVNVNLTGPQNIIEIDHKSGYAFTGDFAF